MPTTATTPTNAFAALGLQEDLVRGTEAAGFTEPRPIQAETIPAVLAGRDVLGLAQTGTGKTAAFALPLVQRLIESRERHGRAQGPRALIVAPTRELATQIAAETQLLCSHTQVQGMTIFGGASVHQQISTLRRKKPEIIIGCPGRVLDLMNQGELSLDDVETLVLDEADHMFDMGFLPDIRRILSALPPRRQNLLFSATMPPEIRQLADRILDDPHVVELATSAPASTIDHALYAVSQGNKRDLLERLLQRDDCTSAIVFTRTKHRARRLAEQLVKAGHRAVGLQGNMSQNARDKAMGGFRSGKHEILVATDIVARGIDVSGVAYVINFDVPTTAEAYTHRIGRTGRGDAEGQACTFLTPEDGKWLRDTERMIGEPIPRRFVDGFDSGWREPARFGESPRGRGGRTRRPRF